MKTTQKPSRFKSLVELSEVIKIIFLMILATAALYFEYHLNTSAENTHSREHIQEKAFTNAGTTDYDTYEISF